MGHVGKPSRDDPGKTAWHALSTGDTTATLDVDPERGLDDAAVRARRETFGENRLKQGTRHSALRRFISQFNNLFIYLLLVAGIVTGLLGEYLDSGVIFAVVLIIGVIGVIGFVQEGRAERALESVQKILSRDAWVFGALDKKSLSTGSYQRRTGRGMT